MFKLSNSASKICRFTGIISRKITSYQIEPATESSGQLKRYHIKKKSKFLLIMSKIYVIAIFKMSNFNFSQFINKELYELLK